MRAASLLLRRVMAIVSLAFALCGAAEAAPRRIALVVGNSEYQHVPKLDNPARDAALIADTLRSIGFELVGGGAQLDLDRATLERRIREFGRAIGGETVALFYYSGHGLQIRGANYLVPVAANIAAASDVDFELIDVDVVLRQMNEAHSSLNLVILDACRNNPFGGRGLRDGGGGLAEMRAPKGTLISYATQPGGVARDGQPGGDSPYSIALSVAMKTRGVDVFRAFNQVGVDVSQATNGEQTPWLSSSPIDGEFYLAALPGSALPGSALPGKDEKADPPPPAAPMSFDREALYWQSIQSTSRPAELEAYLRQYPNGTFAELARTRVAALQSPNAPTPPATDAGALGRAQMAEAQTLLTAMGLSRAATDGSRGPRIAEAIRLYEHAAGLAETGELTAALLERMRSETPPQSARAAALFGAASASAKDGRSADAAALLELGLKLDPGNGEAARELAQIRHPREPIASVRPALTRPPPDRTVPRPVPVITRPPAPPGPAPVIVQRGSPGPAPGGVNAVAEDARGRRFSAAGGGSVGSAVGEALAQCHGGGAGGCRIVSLAGGR